MIYVCTAQGYRVVILSIVKGFQDALGVLGRVLPAEDLLSEVCSSDMLTLRVWRQTSHRADTEHPSERIKQIGIAFFRILAMRLLTYQVPSCSLITLDLARNCLDDALLLSNTHTMLVLPLSQTRVFSLLISMASLLHKIQSAPHTMVVSSSVKTNPTS